MVLQESQSAIKDQIKPKLLVSTESEQKELGFRAVTPGTGRLLYCHYTCALFLQKAGEILITQLPL